MMTLTVRNSYILPSRLWVLGIAVLFALAACRQEEPPETVAVPSDQEITASIQAQIESAPDVPGEEVNVTTRKGIVTLTGTIDNLLARKRATEIAESVHGVLSVVNDLKITESRPDKAVTTDINQALSEDPVTESWKVSTNVNNGVVTLTGHVESWQERQLVETIVQGVRGVKSIDNNILISNNEARSDEEIRAEVQRTLMMDNRIGDNRVEVDVNNSRVSLSGAVGSAYERSLALEKARVAGVDSISADRLEVQPEFQSQMFRNEELTALTPDQIRQTIERALAYDPRVPESQVEVSVSGNSVTLSGQVENLSSKIAAEDDARNTAGVQQVENNIKVEHKVVVNPEVPTSNEAITTRIHNAILRDPYVEQTAIDIQVDDGIVSLEGKVRSAFLKDRIEQVASNVSGVIAVNNNISVQNGSQSSNR